ncbi:DUF1929 domain-containing protein [Streptomyces sp. NBC_00445]|uniref:DUF1929 domain-containing protein n=1 Tax=Streptomyces sp. NBC_00445 TaxID=2975745 RepID=UPI002E22A3BF
MSKSSPRPTRTGAAAARIGPLGGRTDVAHGSEVVPHTTGLADISRVRLMRPGSATHVTDFDQRSVALDITRRTGGALTAAAGPEGQQPVMHITHPSAKFTQCNDAWALGARTP